MGILNSKWFPDRKVWAGGLSAVVAWFILQAIKQFIGIDLGPEAQTYLSGAIGWLVQYFVPPAARDIVKKLNNELVAAAQADPEVPVTEPIIVANPPSVITVDKNINLGSQE